jgi:DNA polymerase III sliding clamp (beta) subunit (PCNA family)
MKQAQILTALNLPGTKDNKQFCSKLEKICSLINEVKKLPFFSFELGATVSNAELIAKVDSYKNDPYYPKHIGSDRKIESNFNSAWTANEIINTFPAYQALTIRFGDIHLEGAAGEYKFDIPTNNAFCNYIMSLIGCNVTTSEASQETAKKPYYRAILPAGIIDRIKAALPYVSTDSLRPNLGGVCLSFIDNKHVDITACDAHRLYLSNTTCEASSSKNKSHTFILPVDFCKKLIAFKRKDIDEPVELRVYRETIVTIETFTKYYDKQGDRLPEPIEIKKPKVDNQLTFDVVNTSGGNLSLAGVFIQGAFKYPRYQDVIPALADQPYNIEVDKATLINHIALNLPVANQTTNQIQFHFNGKVAVQAFDIDFSRESKTEFDYISSTKRDDFDIAFNGKLLIDILKNIKCKTVKLAMSQATRAMHICEPGRDDIRIIMPLMLSGTY